MFCLYFSKKVVVFGQPKLLNLRIFEEASSVTKPETHPSPPTPLHNN